MSGPPATRGINLFNTVPAHLISLDFRNDPKSFADLVLSVPSYTAVGSLLNTT